MRIFILSMLMPYVVLAAFLFFSFKVIVKSFTEPMVDYHTLY